MSTRRSTRAPDAVLLSCLLLAAPVLAQDRPSGVSKEIEIKQFDATHQRDVPTAAYWDGFLTFDTEKGSVSQGRSQKDVDLEDFYRMVDRPEYVKKVKAKKSQRDWMLAGAGVLAAAGITTGFILLFQPITPTDCGGYFGCQYDNTQHVGAALPIILGSLFAGGILAGWALNMPLDPTSRDESKRLADDYNARLKERSLDPSETAPPPDKAPGATLQIFPFGTRGGGGLALGGRF